MGTLRIKRGTTSARTGFTPVEAELIYDTNTKEVYVGDGSTQGGIAVSVSTQNLENLGNVQSLTPQKDQLLVYNGSNWAATDNPALDIRGNIYADDSTLLVDAINGKIVGPIQTSSVISTTLTGTLTGDTIGSHTGSVVGNVVGTVVGDLKGSVFADDSTAIVDSNNNAITTGTVTATSVVSGTLSGALKGTLDGSMTGSVFSDGSTLLVDGINSRIVGNVNSPEIIAGTGGITINGNQPNTLSPQIDAVYTLQSGQTLANSDILSRFTVRVGTQQKFTMQSRQHNTYYSHSDDGTTGITQKPDHSIHGGMKLKIEPANADFTAPTEALEVLGNIKGTGFVQFGSLTTTQRNALTAANGMVIYNTTDNKFQGYENGSWANLI